LLKTQIVYVPLGFGKQNLKLLIIYRYWNHALCGVIYCK
jgi:hypothetical protein